VIEMPSKPVAFIAATVILLLPAASQPLRRGEATLEPYTLTTYDGQAHPAELGHFWVPESRQKNSSRPIRIAFVRLKSTAAHPGSPIVYLAGGPGVPASGMARVPVYYELFEKLRQVADIVLLDQRGSGMSSPNLSDCPTDGRFPADAFASRETFVHALAHATGNCSWYWRSKGVDVTGYNTEESADDVEDLRKALGAARISLLGHSYGTELALCVIRRHGDSVERAVLASVEGPGDHGTLPAVVDLQLRKIARLAAADAKVGSEYPDLAGLLQADMERLKTHPATLTVTKQVTKKPVDLTVGAVALQFVVEQMLHNGRAVTSLPALLQSLSAGDDGLFRRKVEDLYNDLDSGITLMGRTMDCAAATPPERLAQAQVEARTSLFADVSRIDMQPEVCKEALGRFSVGQEYFAPLYSTVSTLFLSGTLDADTPPMKAERMRWGFPRSTHIVVENGFHETLPADEVQALVVDFLQGKEVADRHVAFPAPHFLSLADAKQAERQSH
jgi:pimeloyl-ACP methyl ester carboxylesterase